MNFENNTPYRLSAVAAMLQAGCGLSSWCFSKKGKLYFTTSAYEKELHAFMKIGGCLDYALTEGIKLDTPFVMSDSMGLIWFGEFTDMQEDYDRLLVVIGPMFNSETNLKTIEERMREAELSPEVRNAGKQILVHVPIMSLPVMYQYIKMFHFSVTKKIISPEDVTYQSMTQDDPFLAAVKMPPKEKHFIDYENSFSREKLIMQCIREGNLNYREVVGDNDVNDLPDDYLTGDPVREAKNAAIIFVSQCCRAAIDGKLSIKAAKDIEVQAVRRIEKCRTVTELIALRSEVMKEYITRVHTVGTAPGISQPIIACCDYVKAHFMEPIELEDIAKSVGYTEYYLTRKFQREMGIKLSEYIRKVRLEYAKIWLASTEISIQEISEQLRFASRNYFTRVFKAQEGISPMEYREKARVIDLA